MLPLDKLLDSLRLVDEVQLIDLLDIRTEHLIERFEDKIKERIEYISKELEMIHEPCNELNFD